MTNKAEDLFNTPKSWDRQLRITMACQVISTYMARNTHSKNVSAHHFASCFNMSGVFDMLGVLTCRAFLKFSQISNTETYCYPNPHLTKLSLINKS